MTLNFPLLFEKNRKIQRLKHIKLMNPPSIIAMAPNLWSSPWRNRQQLLSRLAKRGWTVVYSTGLLMTWELSRHYRKKTPWFISQERANQGVKVFEPCLFPFRVLRFKILDKLAIHLYSKRLLKSVGGGKVDLLIIFHPMFFPYAQALKPKRLVYYCFDSLKEEWQVNPELFETTCILVDRADLVISSSEAMAAELPLTDKRKLKILPNAADSLGIMALAHEPCPPTLAAIPKPRIGYVGVINKKINFNLIVHLAQVRPDWHWVLLGPKIFPHQFQEQDSSQFAAFRTAEMLPNVHFLDRQTYPDFLIALHHMDVHVLCNRTDEGWWQSASPLKFHEYLASGRPVVSSPLDSLKAYADVCAFADNNKDWLNALTQAIENQGVGTIEQRQAIAKANDWQQRTDDLEKWLLTLIN